MIKYCMASGLTIWSMMMTMANRVFFIQLEINHGYFLPGYFTR